MTTFNLPDLGEGLPEAEIVAWHVKEGDCVEADQPMLSVETAKAVVDVPSPYTGRIVKLHAKTGDTVETGKPLVDFDLPASTAAPSSSGPRAIASSARSPAAGQGMVVGHMASIDEEFVDAAIAGSSRRATVHSGKERVRAAPAVRLLAKRLGVDLSACQATGRHGLVSVDDVLAAADHGATRTHATTSTDLSGTRTHAAAPADLRATRTRATAPAVPDLSDAERLRGARKAMSHSMALSRDEVAMCTIFDDADIEAWKDSGDITIRLVRAIVAGAEAEPGLNAWFDPRGPARRLIPQLHLAIAVDTSEGLIVPVLRDVGARSAAQLREALNDIKERTRNRTITPDEMRDSTFTLSNFGTMAGRYGTPLVIPPAVAILGAGKLQRDVVAGADVPEIRTRLPLSLTFDHRCITGGEACRFLAAVIADLQKSS